MLFKYLALVSSITYVGRNGFLLKKDEIGTTPAGEIMSAGPHTESSFLSTQVKKPNGKEMKEKKGNSSFLSTQVKKGCIFCDNDKAGCGSGQDLNGHVAPPKLEPLESDAAKLIAAAKVQLTNLETNVESAVNLAERVKSYSNAILIATGKGKATGGKDDGKPWADGLLSMAGERDGRQPSRNADRGDGDANANKMDDNAEKSDGKEGKDGNKAKDLSEMTEAELTMVSDNAAKLRDDYYSIQITVGAAGLGEGPGGLPEEIDEILKGIPESGADAADPEGILKEKKKILAAAESGKEKIKKSNDEATKAKEAAEEEMAAILASLSDNARGGRPLKIIYTVAIAKGDLDQLKRRVARAEKDIGAKTENDVSKMTSPDKASILGNLDGLAKLSQLSKGDVATALNAAGENPSEYVHAAKKMEKERAAQDETIGALKKKIGS